MASPGNNMLVILNKYDIFPQNPCEDEIWVNPFYIIGLCVTKLWCFLCSVLKQSIDQTHHCLLKGDGFPDTHTEHISREICSWFRCVVICCVTLSRADSRLAPNQWEMWLQSNAVSHWLGANLESALLSADTNACVVTLKNVVEFITFRATHDYRYTSSIGCIFDNLWIDHTMTFGWELHTRKLILRCHKILALFFFSFFFHLLASILWEDNYIEEIWLNQFYVIRCYVSPSYDAFFALYLNNQLTKHRTACCKGMDFLTLREYIRRYMHVVYLCFSKKSKRTWY